MSKRSTGPNVIILAIAILLIAWGAYDSFVADVVVVPSGNTGDNTTTTVVTTPTTTISQPPVSSVVVTYETRETADRELRDVVRGNIFDPNSSGELSYGNMALFIGSALFIIAMIAGCLEYLSGA